MFKGVWRGQEIAVKKLRKDKVDNISTIFTELKVAHQFPAENILPLMGISFSSDLTTEPCLVYQFMINGSVSDRLRQKNGTSPLSW